MALFVLAIAEPAIGMASDHIPDATNMVGQPVSTPYKLRIYGLASDGVAPTPTPPPAPTATPEPDATVLAAEPLSIPEIICSFPWPCQEALAVARCESGLDPYAYNRSSGASGLFQLLMVYHRWRLNGGSEFDPWANTAAAYSLWLEQRWTPWVCRP